ncbi:GntR family transcriptional regulator [Roseovarius sp. M141]|uniref:GntR family transcriptional regulator n=1 Tax=Roseovarius sp. M141 TaxID=2583806 RepID=UPI0020CFC42E|nr:GntR family transcriptional regulator [Roseovarius sp. M141]MCQ0090800.1 GntR family transcriptional regulator [Roseovarius sp. M141]
MNQISRESLGDAIYDRVSQDLVRGKLRPNQRITIRGLAEALGTSSTPVRDAVQRLLQDDALVQRSVRDVRVPVPSAAQYLEIASIRRELEGLAAARAAEVATSRGITRLTRLTERNQEAITAARWTQAAELNQQFHFALAEIARMPVLLGVLTRLWLRMGPLIAGYYSGAQVDMIHQHHVLIAALEARDPDAARAALYQDIDESGEGIVAYINTFEVG